MVSWLHRNLLDGILMVVALVALIAFRHFNRISTWQYLRVAFLPCKRTPQWHLMDEELFSAPGGLHKAFSRPVTCLTEFGEPLGTDTISNATLTFKRLFALPALRACAALIEPGVTTVEQFDDLMSQFEKIRSALPGAFGKYRQKNLLDILIAASAISPWCLRWYPVAAASGTADSLRILYGIKTKNEGKLKNLLLHFYHQLRRHSAGKSKADSLATASLVLCGWHRSKETCKFGGRSGSGLDRAIWQEEKEFLAALIADREESDDT